jgi:hypothetical protein
MAFRPSAFRRGKSRESGLFGGSPVLGLVLGAHGIVAALCWCTKSNAQTPAWGAYAESTSGRRSS